MTKEEKENLERKVEAIEHNFEDILSVVRMTRDERDQLEGHFYNLINTYNAYLNL